MTINKSFVNTVTKENKRLNIAFVGGFDKDSAQHDILHTMQTPEGKNALLMVPCVYNPDTLGLQLMTQPNMTLEGELTVSMEGVEALLSDNYFKQIMYDYDVDGNIIYIGRHLVINAADTDTAWWIWKLTYSNGFLTRKQGPIIDAYSGRTGLGW